MIYELKTQQMKQPLNIKGTNFIAITGKNGVGKTIFLESLTNSKNFDFEESKFFFEADILDDSNGASTFLNVSRTWTRVSGDRKIDSTEMFNGANNHKTIQNYASKILNINKYITSEINDRFSSLERRIIAFFNKMSIQTTKAIVEKNGVYNNDNVDEFEFVRLKKAIDFFLEGKELIGVNSEGRKALIRDIDGIEKWIGDSLSQGEKIIFSIATLLVENQPSNTFFIWDEPENGLNPRWQRQMMPFISKLNKNIQIFFTTHSMAILNSLNNLQNSKTLKLVRDEEGVELIETSIFDDEELKNEHTLDISTIQKLISYTKKLVLVEGESDKILLEQFFDSNEYWIISCGSDEGVVRMVDVINHLAPKAKIISVLDNDSNKKPRFDNIRIFFTNLLGLPKGKFAIEKYFEDIYKSDSFYANAIKFDNSFCDVSSGRELSEDVFNKRIDQFGFIPSDKYRLANITPSKVESAKYLIKKHKSVVEQKLSELIKFIKEK